MVDVLWVLRKEINMSSRVMKKLESGIDVEFIRNELFDKPNPNENVSTDIDRFQQFVGYQEERYLKKASRYGAAHGRLLERDCHDDPDSRPRFETWNPKIPGHGVEFTETGIIIATNGASSQVKRELSLQPPTVWYYDYPALQKFFNWFTNTYGGTVRKANFYISPAGKGVSIHTDSHSYFKDKDRFHLILAGKYEYTVNGETLVFKKGELWWFNNKAPHGSYNHGDEDKINLVFDVAGLRT